VNEEEEEEEDSFFSDPRVQKKKKKKRKEPKTGHQLYIPAHRRAQGPGDALGISRNS